MYILILVTAIIWMIEKSFLYNPLQMRQVQLYIVEVWNSSLFLKFKFIRIMEEEQNTVTSKIMSTNILNTFK